MLWEDNWLAHHGIPGMHWGVRRYQNADGTLTAAGKERYGQNGDGGGNGNSNRSGGSNGSASNRNADTPRKAVQDMCTDRPNTFSKKNSQLIDKIASGEVLSDADKKAVDALKKEAHAESRKAMEAYEAATDPAEKEKLAKDFAEKKKATDLAYRLDAAVRLNQYEHEIKSETDPSFIDPSYRTFDSKEAKAKAEGDYIEAVWYSGHHDDEATQSKINREAQHLYDRVANMSMAGYDGIPISKRNQELYDFNATEGRAPFSTYDNWTPKYEKSPEWKELQSKRDAIKQDVGWNAAYDKAYKTPFYKDGKFDSDAAAKAFKVYNKINQKYREKAKKAGIDAAESRIEDKFQKQIMKNVLQDLGYEITDRNLSLIGELIWYD